MAELTKEELAYFESGGTDMRAFGGKEPALPPDPVESGPEPAPQPEAEAKAPESAAKPAEDDDDDGADPNHMVPYRTFKAERQRRQALEKEHADLRDFRARMEERLAYLQERDQRIAQEGKAPAAAEAEEKPKAPSFDEDFVGATEHLAKKVESISERLEREETERQQSQQREAFLERVREDELSAKREIPDFDQALVYLRDARIRELGAFGITPEAFQEGGKYSPEAAAQRFAHFLKDDLRTLGWNITTGAARNNRSPARAVYEFAKARGYSPKPIEQAVADIVDNPADRKEEARRASMSLSRTSGGPTGPMTLERLDRMTKKEFAAYCEAHPDVVDRLLGK